jgi:hypothetical protein
MLACQKEEKETDFEKGKRNGKACCDCLKTASTENQKSLCLLQHLDLNKFAEVGVARQLNDYTAGLLTAPCMLELLSRDSEMDYADDFADLPPEE